SGAKQRWHGRGARGKEDVWSKREQCGCEFASVILIAAGPPVVDLNIVPNGPSQLLQPLQKCRVADLGLRIVRIIGHEHARAPHTLTLLRARRERPCRRHAAEERDELASPHSITSSAVASRVGGTVRPSILAVWALMTSSNLLDCTTGSSAGFAPLRICPQYTPT